MAKISIKTLSVYFLAFAIVIVNIPSISRRVGGAGILLLLALVFLINNGLYLKSRNSVTTLLVVLYIGLEIFYEFAGISNCDSIYYFYTISFLLFALIGPPLIEKLDRRQENVLLVASFGSLLYVMYANLRLKIQYGSSYVRLGDILSASTNVISTQYISAIVLVAGILLTSFIYAKRRRFLALALLIVSIAFEAFVGQRMIAILLLIVMIAMQLLVTKKRTVMGYTVTLLIIILVAVVAINLENILLWISSAVDNIRITRRINQILYMIRAGKIEGAGGSLEVRFNLMMNSLRTFISSPLHFVFGVGENRSSNLIVGHHSQWADQAAKYGIIGLILLASTLRSCFQSAMYAIQINKYPYLKKQFVIFICYFVVRGLLGAVLYPYFGIVLFVVIPIIMKRLSEEDNIIHLTGESI